jgi:hypothetical protein
VFGFKKNHFYTQFFEKKHGKIFKNTRCAGGGGGLEIFKNFAASAAARLHLFLIGGGGSADRLTPLDAVKLNKMKPLE